MQLGLGGCRSGQSFPYWAGGSGAGGSEPPLQKKPRGEASKKRWGKAPVSACPSAALGLRAQSFHAGRVCGARDKTQLIPQ